MFLEKTPKHRVVLAHRVSWALAFGDIPVGQYVLHQCDNPRCVNPNHLFLGDQLANIRDCVSKGRIARGSKNGQSKLTEEQVLEIRQQFTGKRGQQAKLAHKYHVSRRLISFIVRGDAWKHV
jgi:hypothetical protein